MHFNILSLVVEELDALLTNARVDRVYQGSGGGLYLLLNRERKKFILLLSPDRALPRLHLVSVKPDAEDPPHGFILFLRSRVSGARLKGISLMNQDRVVEIRFSRQGEECLLLFELFGSSANLIVVDASSTILAVYNPVPPAEEASRSLLPGLRYSAPEKPGNTGFQKSNLPSGFETGASANKAAERYYENLIERKHIAALRTELSSRIRKDLSKTVRLISALSGDLESADRVDEYRQAGDLVLAHLKELRTGMERADLTGYDGTTVPVLLDPKRSPSGNAELYFKKYKKAKKGRDIIAGRLRQSVDQNSYLKSLLNDIEQAHEVKALLSIRSGLIAQGRLDKKAVPHKITRQKTASPAIRTIMFNGWEILVGKSAAGNDHLTMKLARPDDLWLHAEGMPGSHVLVRNPNAGVIPPEVLVKAAALAAFHSKGKHAGKVPVTYTRAGLVKKPRGAKPGLVTLQERKSLMVKPEDG
ncbi:MAG: NFACT family protein [Nitrospirae bacterium]|nr:NFACT family protein [Nitrospirota bacterium]